MREILKWVLPITIIAAAAGCAAMEGTNVGVNVPIGGVVNVGASKTIGDGQSSSKPTKNTNKDSEESENEQE